MESDGRVQGDHYGTTELRRRVLSAWTDAAARFREDANAEEDYAQGYRDRVVVELAQNAADAAMGAGDRAKLLLRLAGMEFTAANTGAPLTAAGVESLSTLRASAKRERDTGERAVGRFGVGFAAVVSICDHVTIASRDGAVTWDRGRAAQAVREHLRLQGMEGGAFAEELIRRDDRVPLLRLPFATEAAPLPDYDTAVTLTVAGTAARAALVDQLDRTGQSLLLALPGLAEVTVEVDGSTRTLCREPDQLIANADEERGRRGEHQRIRHVTTSIRDSAGVQRVHWRTVERRGRFSTEILRDRPTEERGRPEWSLMWALPLEESGRAAELPGDIPRTVHAPTPSETAQPLPALLLGMFPLSPDRCHIALGPATDLLLSEAAAAYGELLSGLDARTAIKLIPPRAATGGEFDGYLRERLFQSLPESPFLTSADGESLRPRDAVVLDAGDDTVQAVADVLPTALPTEYARPLAGLGARQIGLAELADLLAGTERDPSWWGRLYRALGTAGQRGADLTDLGALPVPLADGQLVRGPRGLLRMPDDGTALRPESLAALGLRVIHAEAVDPLLERLGAAEANARAVLADPRTRAAVEESLDAEDPESVAEAVLDLVSVCGVTVEDAPWLAELALRDTGGAYCPAGELLLPDSPLRDILVPDAPFGVVASDLVERYGKETLRALGVVHSFVAFRGNDLVLDPDSESFADIPLDNAAEWADHVAELLGDPELPPQIPEFFAVCDLELVREDRWEKALELLSGPEVRPAVTDPVRVIYGDGQTADVPSYTAWWLGTGARIAGRRPVELRTADADQTLRTLYDPAPGGVDSQLASALGMRSTLADLLAAPGGPDELLDRLAQVDRVVSRTQLRRIWSDLADLAPERLSPPERVRALRGGTADPVVVEADDVVVVDAPDLLPLLDGWAMVFGPAERAAALAEVLDLPLASEEVSGAVTSTGTPRKVPDEIRLLLDAGAGEYFHHERLTVDGKAVAWRYLDGQVHASSTDGLARGLAWAAGQWPRRHLVAALLHAPEKAPELLAEADLD